MINKKKTSQNESDEAEKVKHQVQNIFILMDKYRWIVIAVVLLTVVITAIQLALQ